ncbi:WD40 repeat-like protein [Thozetella sp. PMI_491]|nr:WD40 repeat-like protein [Thozetella sp. PMI_491]
MAAEALPLPQLRLPSAPNPVSAEQRYWKSFKNQKSHTSTASWPISHISFPAAGLASSSLTAATKSNDLFAVTAGPRVDLFSIRKRELVKTIGRFDSEAHSGEIRPDGRILLAGDGSGKIQTFDVANGSRAVQLKTWQIKHKLPVWVTKWCPTDLTSFMSASDDKAVRLWELSSNDPTRVFNGHSDYVRSGAFMPGSGGNLVVSGSYDETVRVWDARAPKGSVLTFKHADPIEEVLPLNGTTILAAAGSNISVLDLVAAKPLRLISNHQRTVTSLCLASNSTRVISGGLDGHVKVFETTGWNVVAGSKYPSPILSLSVVSAGANHDDRHLVVGMQSGVLSVRTRLTGAAADKERGRAAELAAFDLGREALAKFDKHADKKKQEASSMRTMEMLGEGVDAVIEVHQVGANGKRKRRIAEKPWEYDLRHGRYAQALDAVIDTSASTYQPLTALTLLMALRHRSALREALEGRDEVTVQPIMRWISKYITDSRYVGVCTDVALHLMDLYSEYLDASPEMAAAFNILRGRVTREVEKAQMAIMTNGMVESLMMGALTDG